MIGNYKPKIPHPCVVNVADFTNGFAIGGNRRLGLGDFESYISSPRFNQRFLREVANG